MATHNAYAAYKRDTQHLLYWMIGASNKIITSSNDAAANAKAPNTTGQTTVAGLVDMARLIAQHISAVPPVIYRLLQSVINARQMAYAAFRQLAEQNPDPELVKSNASHKCFIDALAEAFRLLGGDEWESKRQTGGHEPVDGDDDDDDGDDDDKVIFSNKFAALNLDARHEDGDSAAGGSSADETEPESRAAAAPRRRQQKRSSGRKGKKAKGKPGGKRRQRHVPREKEPTLDDVPLESYRIIEDGAGGLVTDYLLAVYNLVSEMGRMRSSVQTLWHQVAYDGLNGAVAGATSNVAFSIIKQLSAEMFVEFPGHDSYETVINTITRGDPDKAQGMFSVALYRQLPGSGSGEKVRETHVDVKEHFLLYAFKDLCDFIADFQKTHSGKPTKRMLAEIGGWDPNLDLQKATHQERMQWRRSYTINWLYDLVNVFSSIVVQRITLKGEKHDLSRVDWSTKGPWNIHRRLFGLNEFAGDVTHWAMQKAGTNVKPKILPHHVLQLQCIVDSLTVSRGWSQSVLHGHLLKKPPRGYRPRRDVDRFLDRNSEHIGTGYLPSTHVVKQVFEKDGTEYGDPKRHSDYYELLQALHEDFVDWLGESKYMSGLTSIPPSRFAHVNTNGLWEYSPFLCGVGLMEGLELAYTFGIMVWDRISEPMLAIHLHNMLVERGYIKKPIGLFTSLQSLFNDAFFVNGVVPTSCFHEALAARTGRDKSKRAVFKRRRMMRMAASEDTDPNQFLRVDTNTFFTDRWCSLLYRAVGWNPEKIREEDIPIASLLAWIRLTQKKTVTDPKTGEKRHVEETDLVRRATAVSGKKNMSEALSSLTRANAADAAAIPDGMRASATPSGFDETPAMPKRSGNMFSTDSGAAHNCDMSASTMLMLLKEDFYNEICGYRPALSLNLNWTLVHIMLMFFRMERKLKEAGNQTYLNIFHGESQDWKWDKRVGLAYVALAGEDDELLPIMAEAFENVRGGFLEHVYWEDLDLGRFEEGPRKGKVKDTSLEEPELCVVM